VDETRRPSVDPIKARTDQQVREGDIPACDSCDLPQIYGCSVSLSVGFRLFYLCTECFTELLSECESAKLAHEKP
jgi:hypothetical protein